MDFVKFTSIIFRADYVFDKCLLNLEVIFGLFYFLGSCTKLRLAIALKQRNGVPLNSV